MDRPDELRSRPRRVDDPQVARRSELHVEALTSVANPCLQRIHVPVLDVAVTAMSARDVVARIHRAPSSATLLLNHNLHSVYLFHKLPWFRQLYATSEVIVIDGWPVLRMAGRRAPVSPDHRIGSTDWISCLWNEDKPRPLRVFLLGGSKEVSAIAVDRWLQKRPKDEVAGNTGYLNGRDEGLVIEAIRAHRPDLVLVGMGMPMQESFISRHLTELPAAHYATVGGAIDYIAAPASLSPRWLGRFGLEWVWRLLHNPGRLWARYLIEPFKLALILAANKFRKSPRQ
ncbi:WecB/TagA/CpsF family glycosyltransferase [Clavibacter sp. MX14-G9D]|uniref:WecB/TagA/CpsF family glycosyltransferase n=1 Tax=Clavibacter sp. MX14-G9D TaxID=3064656 RepID=UPI00293EC885|nr:WecB/TagA/CpsF family glycosyltransferase [Clavibacter sp. MX14-G9D]